MAGRTRHDRPFGRELQGSQGTAAAAGGGGVWQRCPHTSLGGRRGHRSSYSRAGAVVRMCSLTSITVFNSSTFENSQQEKVKENAHTRMGHLSSIPVSSSSRSQLGASWCGLRYAAVAVGLRRTEEGCRNVPWLRPRHASPHSTDGRAPAPTSAHPGARPQRQGGSLNRMGK